MLPIVAPGIAATALLCFIFAWNEFFLAVQLNPVESADRARLGQHERTTRGNFMAKIGSVDPGGAARRHRRLGRPEAHDPQACPWAPSSRGNMAVVRYQDATRTYPGTKAPAVDS